MSAVKPQPGTYFGRSPVPGIVALNGRAAALFWVLMFCACMISVYITWLSPNYWYLGFTLAEGDTPVLWLSTALLLLSASWLPSQVQRLSDFLLWMLFYFVYAPSMLFVPLQGRLQDGGLSFVCALFVSYTLMQLCARYRLRLPQLIVSRRTFMTVLLLATAGLNLYVLSVFAGNLKIATIADIYTQRFESADLAEGTLVGYASGVLAGAINPFLMAVGLTERRKFWLFAGIAGQVFIYATAAMKSVLLSGVLAPIFYYFLIRQPRISGARLGVLIMASCAAPLIATALLDQNDSIIWSIVALILMRTYGMTGVLSGVYADFFSSHPHTYFSHIGPVSIFVDYPYAQSLGQEVGWFLVGSRLDANANFWASDGLAGAGNLGVVLMGLVVGAFLVLSNSLLQPAQRRFACVASLFFIVAISNTSFFTSLLSDGGALLLFMIYAWQAASAPSRVRGSV